MSFIERKNTYFSLIKSKYREKCFFKVMFVTIYINIYIYRNIEIYIYIYILLSKSFHNVGSFDLIKILEFSKYGLHPEENLISNGNNQNFN